MVSVILLIFLNGSNLSIEHSEVFLPAAAARCQQTYNTLLDMTFLQPFLWWGLIYFFQTAGWIRVEKEVYHLPNNDLAVLFEHRQHTLHGLPNNRVHCNHAE